MQFAEGFSPQALQEMQLEAERIVRKAGVNPAFKYRHEAAQETYNDLFFFKMSGRCEMDSFPPSSTNGDRWRSPSTPTDESFRLAKSSAIAFAIP